jgi:hypothetical protein
MNDTLHPHRRTVRRSPARARLLAVCALFAAWSAPAVADACSPSPCDFGTSVPGDMAVVPANLPGVFWRTDDGVDADVESVRLVRLADDQDIPLEVVALGNGRHEVKILETLVPEAAHALVLGSVCQGTGLADETAPLFELTTTAEQPLPDDLGALNASSTQHGSLGLASIDGGCAAPVASAYVDVEVTLSAAVLPWTDVLVYETLVDGKLWRPSGFLPALPPEGESWLGRGVDRVFATCEVNPDVVEDGVAEGLHEVQMRARIPASGITLTTAKVEVLLTCLDPDTTTGDDDGTSTGDPSTPSGGTAEGDAGTTVGPPGTTMTGDEPTGDASTGPGDPESTGGDPPTDDDDSTGGCTCRASTPGGAIAPAFAVLLVAGLARRRRG